jgi:hypothetical protein
MTDPEWLAGEDPLALLSRLFTANSSRLWLFACACCRLVVPEVTTDKQLLQALEDAESCAAGLIDRSELENRWHRWWQRWREMFLSSRSPGRNALDKILQVWRPGWSAWRAAMDLAAIAQQTFPRPEYQASRRAERRSRGRAKRERRLLLCELLRDIFGNSRQPRSLDPELLIRDRGMALKVARAILDERRFGDLPVLGDALEEAGCTDQDILDHCRLPRPHALGCWVVDLVLGSRGRGPILW